MLDKYALLVLFIKRVTSPLGRAELKRRVEIKSRQKGQTVHGIAWNADLRLNLLGCAERIRAPGVWKGSFALVA